MTLHVRVDKSLLLPALAQADRVCDRKSLLPHLAWVKLEAAADLRLLSTDLEVFATWTIPWAQLRRG